MNTRTGDTYQVPMSEGAQPMKEATAAKVGFRELSPLETQYVTEIRALGEQLKLLTDRMPGDSCDGRAVALARTHFQEGLMWAVRAVTKPAFF